MSSLGLYETSKRVVLWAIGLLLFFTVFARGGVPAWVKPVMHLLSFNAFFWGLGAGILTKTPVWKNTCLDRPLIFAVLLCVLSFVFSMNRSASVSEMLLWIDYAIVFYLTTHVIDSKNNLIRIARVLIAIGVFLSVFGILKRYGYNPLPWWDYAELPYPSEFVSATYGNHNHLAGALEMILPLAVALLVVQRSTGEKVFLWAGVLSMGSALILSLSRGGWISASGGLLFWAICLLCRKRFVPLKAPLIIGIVCLSLSAAWFWLEPPVKERAASMTAFETENPVKARIRVWQGIVGMIADRPLTGTGPGTFAGAFSRYQPPGFKVRYHYAHNDYLHYIAELGIGAGILIAWAAFLLYQTGLKKIQHGRSVHQTLTLGALSGITALMIHSLVDFNLHIPANALIFTVLAAIAASPAPDGNGSGLTNLSKSY